MRILWLSPWLRPLSRAYGQQLRSLGDDVLLITSDLHPQASEPVDWEIVTDPRPKSLRTWPEFARTYARARDFDPDIVVTEFVRDPRWLALGALAPRVHFAHDDRPHGAEEHRPYWERMLFDRLSRSTAAATVCFSTYVAENLQSSTRSESISVVPLTSDLSDDLVDEPTPSIERSDFVLIGRLNEYKNLAVVFEAWERHVQGASYRGDMLRIFGSASRTPALPASAWWNGGSYNYRDVLGPLRQAKASIAHYRVATQSGVQVLSMQLGVAPIVSTEGALPEFQPEAPMPLGVDDVAALAEAFDQLADPEYAAKLGAEASAHYREYYAVSVASASLRRVLTQATAQAVVE
ncbi:glycosyltransferase [Gordonia otitidis]|uniref:Glycosyltransferase subfamily 4-like N-terminal domain-containing protein n=1 Tax=Gordonia otitidis (strain DSM 44809 / CCUG 52243 / JCM 12355 / NBRC 100426 / IFM 10032) TaxID=1108044 RepID=H5TKJ5_GORO1|nr:glycosyltransferase [Gordonia otitidis]GAB34003.1 hypothetical protein GOOTI_090_00320 [Gordonia otitidis NBRC 100426]